jgi:hypothetical protein
MINELNYNTLGEIDYTNTNIDRRGNYLNSNYFPDYTSEILKSKVVNKPVNPFQRPYTNFNPEFDTKPLWKNGNKLSTEHYLNTNTNLFQKLKGNFQANSANMSEGMENFANKVGATNPADAVLKGVNMLGDVTSGALSALAKPGSKGSAYAEGSQMAQSVVKPLENIPIVGQASKLISGIIGGALGARKQGIRNKEEDKQFKLTEYLDRNLITATTPSYYGQYHAKYGANPKMMEQRIIDDIYSDFDKYLKIV